MLSISIVTPAYITTEHERGWLEECIESVRAQSIKCEHVIWDDASPIDISDLKRECPDVVWRGWTERKGVCWTRNAAVAMAQGPLILPLDADDKFDSQAAEKLLAAWAGAGPHSFAYANVKMFGAGLEMDKQLPAYDFGLVLKTCLAPVSILYPKQAWVETGGYDADFESGMEDWVFLIAIGVEGYCGVHVDEALLHYRSRPGSRRSAMRGRSNEIVQQVREKFAAIYRGERPESCCKGDGRVRVPSVASRPPLPQGAPQPRNVQDVVLRYIGDKQGNFQIFMRPWKKYVMASARRPTITVTADEAKWILERRKDFARTQEAK